MVNDTTATLVTVLNFIPTSARHATSKKPWFILAHTVDEPMAKPGARVSIYYTPNTPLPPSKQEKVTAQVMVVVERAYNNRPDLSVELIADAIGEITATRGTLARTVVRTAATHVSKFYGWTAPKHKPFSHYEYMSK